MEFENRFFRCLFRSAAENPVVGNIARDTVARHFTTMRVTGIVPTACGETASIESTAGTVSLLNTTTRITLTLI
jgi:hypothetical protein